MKIFIWDDRSYKLIESDEEYNHKEWCIVHKLFVRWNATHRDVENQIKHGLEYFGKVECVEIITDKPQPHFDSGGRKMDVTHEAYVTFVQSSDAYKTVTSDVMVKNVATIAPADTWHQPDYKEVKENPIKGFIKCNHKCGMDAITYAVDDLSIDQDKGICEHTAMEFVLDLKPGAKLNEIRRILRSVKSNTDHLTLNIHNGFDRDALEDCIDTGTFQKRVMEVIGMNGAGPKLKELTIDGLGSISSEMLKCLAPLLKPIETLNIESSCCNVLYLLPKFCPNVTEMSLCGRKWKGESADPQHWASVNYLSIKSSLIDIEGDPDDERKFRKFISMNQQLETLELGTIVDNALLKTVAKNIRNLKHLTVKRFDFDASDGMIDQLVRMKHLATIFIPTYTFKTNNFKSLLSCVESFSKMKRLKMSTLLQNYVLTDEDPFTSVDDFPIQYHSDCNCHGPNSRAFTFNEENKGVDLPKNKAIVAIMVGVSRDLVAADKTLNSRLLTMFKATNKFFPNVLKSIVIEEPHRLVYTHIGCAR